MDINKARALFFEEAYEQCDNLEHALLDRDTYPAHPDTYNLMFRTAHTIKGSAGMLGLTMLVRFAHAMENMLERLRSGEIYGLDIPGEGLVIKRVVRDLEKQRLAIARTNADADAEEAKISEDLERSREIADRLGVSVRTVDNLLQTVYRKLGVSSRDELRAALVEAGLAAD